MVTATLDAANSRIEDARQSNNASAMRSAVADLQVALAQMKVQLADCVSLSPSASGMPGMPGMDRSKTAMATLASAQSQTNADTSATAPRVDIAFKSQPTPLKTGDNQFEVTVKDIDGTPIADADVSVLFVLPAMPAMKMPETRNEVTLQSAGGGKYTGSGQVMTAGQWNVTISVKKNAKEIGQKKVTAVAQ